MPGRFKHAATSARSESGFTLALVMFVMLTTSLLSIAAFSAAGGDLRGNQRSTDEKKAFAAAEAGVAFYLSKLADDNDYWSRCDDVPAGADGVQPVHQPWLTGPEPTWRWKDVPRTTAEVPVEARAQYRIELIPTKVAGVRRAQCDKGDQTSMIDQATGTFTIRSTGRVGPPGAEVKRAVLATFRRKTFLDSVYHNDIEYSDPVLVAATRPDMGPGFPAWIRGQDGCAIYQRDGREDNSYSFGGRTYVCGGNNTIRYAASDNLNGPFHTNDGVRIETCGSTVFGRPTRGDLVEFYDSRTPGGAACEGNLGNSIVRRLDEYDKPVAPGSNQELARTALPAYRFVGETRIVLNGANMNVTTTVGGVTSTSTLALPSNGVVSVLDGGGACTGYNVARPNDAQPACGNVFVQGNYARDLTITAARDIVITASVTKTTATDAVLGLVATDYTRVQRTMAAYPCDQNTNDSTASGRTIEAAILSLRHVFMADSYSCGDRNGVLRIFGSIAQKFRGPVATSSGGTPVTGYDKDYSYDDRLRYRSPPFFLTPVQASWKVIRVQERAAR